MKNQLVPLEDLRSLTGFKDTRSVRAWCNDNLLPVITIGRRLYTVENFLELFLEKELRVFVEGHYSEPAKVMQAVLSEDKEMLAGEVERPLDTRRKVKQETKKPMSRASLSLLNDLKKVKE